MLETAAEAKHAAEAVFESQIMAEEMDVQVGGLVTQVVGSV